MRDRVRHRPGAAISATLIVLSLHATPAAAAFGDHPLRRGSHGRDVRVLQRWLSLLGFATTVDGEFGRRTARRVRDYERHHGMRVDARVSRAQARGLRRRAQEAFAAKRAGAQQPVSGDRAVLARDGRTALPPTSAPAAVQAAVAAANRIVDKPYRYGGGHGSIEDDGYDCSGAVSYALHGADLLHRPLDSAGLMTFGVAGEGRWISVYAHRGHAYLVIAGLRLDTSGTGESGPRWRPQARSSAGYSVRHPPAL